MCVRNAVVVAVRCVFDLPDVSICPCHMEIWKWGWNTELSWRMKGKSDRKTAMAMAEWTNGWSMTMYELLLIENCVDSAIFFSAKMTKSLAENTTPFFSIFLSACLSFISYLWSTAYDPLLYWRTTTTTKTHHPQINTEQRATITHIRGLCYVYIIIHKDIASLAGQSEHPLINIWNK